MNGGNTRIEIINIINDITARTVNKETDLGSFKLVCIWLHKLQTTLDITKEQIIKRMKSLNIHIINELINNTANLKYKGCFNFIKTDYFFSEYPNPFDLA